MKKQEVDEFVALVNDCHVLGVAAASLCKPVPMIVAEHQSPLNDNSPVNQEYLIPDGVCGFAWVHFSCTSPENRRLASLFKLCDQSGIQLPIRLGKSYYGGFDLWCPLPTQSMQRKERYCEAFSSLLNSLGYTTSVQSRLD